MDTHKISIRKLAGNPLALNSAIVFVGSMTSNVLSYVYHLIMGRLLGPSGYGELSSLLSLLYIFTVPLLVAQTVLVKFVSGFKAHGDMGQTKTLFVKVTKLFAVSAVIGLPLVIFFSPWVTSFLYLSSGNLLIMIYVLLVFSLLTVVPGSVLTGYQKFAWVSALGAAAILTKLLLSIPLAPWGVPGVTLAAVIASAAVYALYFFPLRFVVQVKASPTKFKKRDAFGFAVPTLFTQLGIISIFSTDIILVRHFFDAHTAGLYAALAILGKIIFYASSAVSMVLFPIAAERAAARTNTRKLIASAVGAVAAISFGLTVLYFLFPDIIVRLLFGNRFSEAGALLGQFGIFISLFSVANIVSVACLAVGKLNIFFVSIFTAVAQIISIMLFHGSIGDILIINIAAAAAFAILGGGYYLLATHEKI